LKKGALMKRALLLTILLALVFWSGAFAPRVAQANPMCTTTCSSSGVTLQCCASSSCTSSSSGIVCDGVSHTCADYDAATSARGQCLGTCFDNYDRCIDSCTNFTCVNQCVQVRTSCINHCPPAPQTSWGC
jgi:hypothetical protein